MYTFSHNTKQQGFTLVELMVSLSLFIIVVIALIGSLYTVNDASRKVQAMRTVMDNLNFAMEAMSRTIRTSENIDCGFTVGDCTMQNGGGTTISMNSTLGERRKVEYRLERDISGKGRLEKKSTRLVVASDGSVTLDSSDIQDWQAITSPEIDVDNVMFYVEGSSVGDMRQPSVMINMEGVASVQGGTTIPFSIQTYLSQRTPE